MSITFLQRRRIQKYLIFLFAIVVLITAIVIWRGFFTERKPFIGEEKLKLSKKIEINFQLLESVILENLQSFKDISLPEGEIGRENPFLPY